MGIQAMIARFLILCIAYFGSIITVYADGIVSAITAAPIHANGIVRDIRSGLNIHLQTNSVQGMDFMDPAVPGFGLPAGGSLEIELVEGFQRDPAIALDDRSILLVAGAPQQGLPGRLLGFTVSEGKNPNTISVSSDNSTGVRAEDLVSPAPGAAFDPIRQRGIKIIHIGRHKAFVSRGNKGVIDVRFKNAEGGVIASGRGEVDFLAEPRPQIYPTNIPHDQRNHNWQRVEPGKVVGVAKNTLPIPFILFAKNEGLGNLGLDGVGVLSMQQLEQLGVGLPKSIARYTGGLIIQDRDGDRILDPGKDLILGGISNAFPAGSKGGQILTPLVREKPFLSVPTTKFNERAGVNIGGSIMQVVFIAGDTPGLYRSTFSLLRVPGDLSSGDGSSFTHTTVVE